MIRSYKFKLYPTEKQAMIMVETLETCRHLYNDSLGERKVNWNIGYWKQQNILPLRKQDNKYLIQVHSQVLQDVLQRLDKAYQAFFKKLATWAELRQMTAYKVERRSGQVILVNPNGTSQKCSGCGAVVQKDLSIRTHECPSCKLVVDRDRNAAINILKLGLEQAHVEKRPLLVRRISKFASMKQEAQ